VTPVYRDILVYGAAKKVNSSLAALAGPPLPLKVLIHLVYT